MKRAKSRRFYRALIREMCNSLKAIGTAAWPPWLPAVSPDQERP